MTGISVTRTLLKGISMPVLWVIFGLVFSLVAVAIAASMSVPVPMLFAAYAGGGAIGILVAAAIVLVTRFVTAAMPVATSVREAAPISGLAEKMPFGASVDIARDAATVVSLPEYRVAAAQTLFTRNQADRLRSNGGFGWPDQPPEELRLALLDLLGYERVRPEDIWDEVQDWLERSAVQCPSDVNPTQKRG